MRRLFAQITGPRVAAVAALVYLLGLMSSATPPVTAQVGGGPQSGTITASGGFVALDTSQAGAVGIQLTGTWTATVAFEGSVDGGTFVALSVIPAASATAEASADVTSATATGAWSANIGGFRLVRARASAYTSGTIVVTLSGAESGGK